ncbi:MULTISPECIES: hypothetical protein [Leptospira]|uniref:Uncharacterized protein n=2 Tax=Leptospira borgpetersenii TaxID=174 RepID=M3GMG8_LEPBO|nr:MULTISPECIES: hypothetical protein [Leptospira]EKP13781.1 hypothetical protein LEP1GSC128_2585 [Leptospira borgpetersenii str. 200801926]EMG02177.1 hypothetical protein LEP1GSC123_0821 [Leptospira borgpetersenii str. 200701203]EMK08635.1 hypothetical protein LEP1GSC066_1525 [Leptospira sp. serovar Kenya str. Sh9]ENO65565.1 hypothetical protein LEP1GSC191_2180 [Leptospira borgpetersenii serovar Mini str. 201000851]
MFHSEYKHEKTKEEIQHTNQNQTEVESDPKRSESKVKQVRVRPELYDK